MTRVPTTATYSLYMSQMAQQKLLVSDLSYQVSTGYKYDSFDQYGQSTYRLLSLQNELAVTEKYLETNTITQVVLEGQESALDGIRTALTDVRSQILEFYSNDLTDMSVDPSEEDLLSLQNVQEAAFEAMSLIAYYLNTQVDGVYIFAGGGTTAPVDFPYTSLEEFQSVYDGDILTYPTSYSAALSSMSTSADVLGGVTLEQEFITLEPKLSTYRGASDNEMVFDSTTNTITADANTFSAFQEGDELIIEGTSGNNQTLTVLSVSEDGSEITFVEPLTDETISDSSGVSLTKGSWEFESVTDPTTAITTNTLTGRVGSFSDLIVGDKVLISGTNGNDTYLTISEISEDGSTITFAENVTPESIGVEDLASGNICIYQSTQTGVITAENDVGTVLSSFDVQTSLSVNSTTNQITGVIGTFSSLTGGQTITITDASGEAYNLYVKSVSEDGKTIDVSTSTPVPDSLSLQAPITVTTHSDISGFVTSSMKGSELQTGDIGFSVTQNTMTATVKNAFSSYQAGDCIIVQGADGNDKMYIIESVSSDGRTVYFSDETPVEVEMSLLNDGLISNGEGITICSTYSVGATVDMTGTSGAYNGLYTVLGVSDDGQQLIVRTEDFPEYGATTSFDSASFATETYYEGGQLEVSYRISETTSVSNTVNASSSAFEKAFRALASVAQGNLLDSTDPEKAAELVYEALSLLDSALTASSTETNGDVTSIQYSVLTKLNTVNTTIENQTYSQYLVEGYISSLTEVDQTEAATMLLLAAENVEVSYAVLSTISSLTLLDYL